MTAADVERVGVVRLSVTQRGYFSGMGCGGTEKGTRGVPQAQARGPGPGRVLPREARACSSLLVRWSTCLFS